MKIASIVIRWLLNITGVSLLLLGISFWTGHALSLLPLHILLGAVLVATVWFDAALALAARVSWPLVALVAVLGLIMPAFGILQMRLLVGNLHWVIRLLHLAIGAATVDLGKNLARRIAAAAAIPDRAPGLANFVEPGS